MCPTIRDVVVIVDPYSTGCVIAKEFQRRGKLVVALWDKMLNQEMKSHVPLSCGNMNYYNECTEGESLEATVESVARACRPHNIVAVLAGGEAGVDLADALSEKMNLRTNGTDIPNRRDKKVQQELIQQAGLRSVRQAGGDKFEMVQEFLQTEEFPVVLKPTQSAGSDGVKLCQTYDEAKDHFELLMNSQMVNGGACPSVLCQEFLRGKEYVVDHVSRDGIHKTVMIWVYDKRPANGSAFVYFSCDPIDAQSPEAQILVPYMRSVLDAIGFRNGPSHGEVIMTKDGPCLVEMNCRAHGGDGNWRPLCRALTGGYSQVEATVDAYLSPDKFNALAELPPSPFKAWGQQVMLVCRSRGTVKSTPGYDVLKHLPSFLFLETGVKIGSKVVHTIDLITSVGNMILLHKDKSVVDKDLAFVRYLEEINGLMNFEPVATNLAPPSESAMAAVVSSSKSNDEFFPSDGPKLLRHMSNDRPELRGGMLLRRNMTTVDASKEAVIVVDPFSTGACIAHEVMKRGYNTIALYSSAATAGRHSHVPLSCDGIKYFAETFAQATLAETVQEVQKDAGTNRIVACIAGSDPGVDLCDKLSEQLGVRTNGTHIANRRDKKLQQELIRDAGLRSIRQAGGSKFDNVHEFLSQESYPLIVKPVESSAAVGVKLCQNYEEAKKHVVEITESSEASGVLCQEFLRGKEFVVDHVSRDGVHKTVMLWVYDKRPANGSSFVYYGYIPVDSESPEAKTLIPYVRNVLDVLGIRNGPSHAEVMMTRDGPCLVEMNCRAHGGDAAWKPLCAALTGGYSQVDATVDAFLDKQQFGQLPNKPPSPFKAYGQGVILVSHSRGTVKAAPGFDAIKNLPSYVYMETPLRPGSKVDYTTDLFTSIGACILMHRDKQVVEADLARIRTMETDNDMFVYEQEGNILSSKSELRLSSMGDTQRIVSDRTDVY